MGLAFAFLGHKNFLARRPLWPKNVSGWFSAKRVITLPPHISASVPITCSSGNNGFKSLLLFRHMAAPNQKHSVYGRINSPCTLSPLNSNQLRPYKEPSKYFSRSQRLGVSTSPRPRNSGEENPGWHIMNAIMWVPYWMKQASAIGRQTRSTFRKDNDSHI